MLIYPQRFPTKNHQYFQLTNPRTPLIMSTFQEFSLIPFADSIAEGVDISTIQSVPRRPTKGKMLSHPLAVQLREISSHINLLGKEFVDEIQKFDQQPLTRELYQIYLDGYIQSTEAYERLLERFKAFHKYRYEKYAYLMDNDVRTIMEGWFKALNLDITGASGSPFRLFVRALGPQVNPKDPTAPPKLRDHSRPFRWYKENKKPQSINELIWFDNLVKKIAAKG